MDRSATADLVVLCAAAALMAAGYALDLAGLPIAPAALLVVFVATIAGASLVLKPRIDAGFLFVVAATFACAMWIASPAFLPVTNGPDVVHHLQLIRVISVTSRLPHDPSLAPYLLEMVSYTPGSHIFAAAVAAWLHVDALRVVFPIAAAFVAVQAGSLYVLARRLIGGAAGGGVAALAAPLLALVPSAYSVGSFVQFFFYAQVVSQAFAVGLLVALAAWREADDWRYVAAVSACAIGVVLSWPIWIIPCAIAVGFALLAAPIRWARRVVVATSMMAPALALAAIHQLTHRGAASILTASGAVTAPSVAVLGIGFIAVAAAGVVFGLRERVAHVVLVFLAATLLTAVALAALGGFRTFYMPFKMLYLAVLPAAVLGAVALARVVDTVSPPLPRAAAGWLPLLLAAALVHGRVPVRRPHGSLSLPARNVALWGRQHVPVACVDYFSRYWLTGYWLHLDVLGNPRLSDRMRDETFDFPDVAAKWIEGRGLPYAIVEDMTAIPREIRPDMEPLQQRGSFVLVRNRRAAACPY